MHSKPLRFLYKKYAGQAPQGANGIDVSYKYGDLLSQKPHSGSLHQLDQLGREFTKLERVQMYFDLSNDPVVCPTQTYSSVGSASTNGRSINSKKDSGSGTSPTRYRSKSQEFQSKYRLALFRSSPEHKNSVNFQNPSSPIQLPALQQNGHLVQENSNSTFTAYTENNTQRKKENPSSAPTIAQSNQRGLNHRGDSELKPVSANNTSLSSNLHVVVPRSTAISRDRVEKFPRCHSSSTIDADRIDSSQYQYLLDDLSSISSSTTLCSIHSDPASSHFSARAQRPSTTATSRATHRLRDLQTCTTNGSPSSRRSKSRHNSFNKSPENQWPPRYAIIPSWPSYEDIQTLNSCGEHRSVLTQLYRRGSRRMRERSNKVNPWNNGVRYQTVHVVPSHTNMECTMCNLYSHKTDPTLVPPNSPLVVSHDCQEEQSRRSTSFSLHVNRSCTNLSMTNQSSRNHSVINSAMAARMKSVGSPDKIHGFASRASRRPDSEHSSKAQNKVVEELHLEPTKRAEVKHVSYRTPSKKDVSYSWDTCKFAYIKAKG